MNFWDSSALVPLLVEEKESQYRRAQAKEQSSITVWYGTLAEISSSLARKRRDQELTASTLRDLKKELHLFSQTWDEVQPSQKIRDQAIRCLYTHPLRAADAFQLAAALNIADDSPEQHSFFTGDRQLRDAAEREGFYVE
jgi:predicted nucleic acid-binding protein